MTASTDAIVKPYRVFTFFAAVLITLFFTWAFSREDIGTQEQAPIEAYLL
jgi:hypothetical protein